MSNIMWASVKYRGHLVRKIPNHFVCAECGSPLIVMYHSSLEDDVQCSSVKEHSGLKSKEQYVQEQAALQQQQQVLAHQEVRAIAMSDKQVAELLRLKNEQSRRELWGDD
jgi:hypothetical protein